MQQLFSVFVYLSLVATIRTAVVPRRSALLSRWWLELAFGLLIAMPLLVRI